MISHMKTGCVPQEIITTPGLQARSALYRIVGGALTNRSWSSRSAGEAAYTSHCARIGQRGGHRPERRSSSSHSSFTVWACLAKTDPNTGLWTIRKYQPNYITEKQEWMPLVGLIYVRQLKYLDSIRCWLYIYCSDRSSTFICYAYYTRSWPCTKWCKERELYKIAGYT